jgi:hypothetical protein
MEKWLPRNGWFVWRSFNPSPSSKVLIDIELNIVFANKPKIWKFSKDKRYTATAANLLWTMLLTQQGLGNCFTQLVIFNTGTCLWHTFDTEKDQTIGACSDWKKVEILTGV